MKLIYKRILFGILALGLIFIGILVALPFVFKDKIFDMAKVEINNYLDAKVDFNDIDISFLRSFPDVSVKLEDFYIVGNNEFKNDTLIFSKNIDFVVNIKSIFSDTGYDIKRLVFNDSKCLVRVLKTGIANWDIVKKDTNQVSDTSKMSFHWKLKEFIINDALIAYHDEKSDMHFLIEQLNHTTNGDLTADSSFLITKSNCEALSFNWDGINYISKAKAEFNANINANLNEMIFTFSENNSKLNQIPFVFVGWLKSIPKGWDMDVVVKTDKVDFKSILSMVPAIYSNSFNEVKAGGNVDLKGYMKGQMLGDYYPSFNFNLNVDNGWFQYPALPKSLKNINISSNIRNIGKTLDETVIDISNFSFDLGGNLITSKLRLSNPVSDPNMELKAQGKINLGMIKEVYPLDKNTNLSGIMNGFIDLAGRKSYFDNNLYEKFRFQGKVDISKLMIQMASVKQDIAISDANIDFNNKYFNINNINLRLGKSDISATGKFENFVSYALYDKTLQGQLVLKSSYFNVSELMGEAPNNKEAKKKKDTIAIKEAAKMNVIKIPKNLNLTLNADFKELMYYNTKISNATGIMRVVDGELRIENMKLKALGGNINMNGTYNTTDAIHPKVNFDFAIIDAVFADAFNQVETVQQLMPLFQKASGRFSTNISFSSILKDNMSPDLTSIISKGLFSTKSVGLQDMPSAKALATALKRSDLTPMLIKDLGLLFEIRDGKINTKPFSFKVKDMNFTLGGITGLDKTIAYQGVVELPDRMNLGKLSTFDVKIGGTFLKPKVEIDLKGIATKLINETVTKKVDEVKVKIEDTKQKALEEARIKKEKAILAAQQKADEIVQQAQIAGDKLIEEARKQGDVLIQKTTNPIAKKAAELMSKKIVDEAKRKANELNTKAKEEAAKLIQKANESVEI